MKLVAEGATSKEIAENLCISVRTVEKHRASFMSKLNLRTTAALTAYAIKHELVTSAGVLKLDLLLEEDSESALPMNRPRRRPMLLVALVIALLVPTVPSALADVFFYVFEGKGS